MTYYVIFVQRQIIMLNDVNKIIWTSITMQTNKKKFFIDTKNFVCKLQGAATSISVWGSDFNARR